jgi:hypothetical protein
MNTPTIANPQEQAKSQIRSSQRVSLALNIGPTIQQPRFHVIALTPRCAGYRYPPDDGTSLR